MAAGISWRPGRPSCCARCAPPAWPPRWSPRRRAGWPTSCWPSIRADLGEDPFDVTVCGDEVPARKPDPAPYRQADAGARRGPGRVRRHRGLPGRGHRRPGRRRGGAGRAGVAAVAEAPGLTLLDSLAGVDVAFLEDLVAADPLVDAGI